MERSEVTNKAIELMKERVNSSFPKGFDGRAVLLFSGGRDSGAVAATFCNAFPQSQLHLLLMDNGLLSRLDSTKRQANLIKQLFPNTDIIFEMKRVSQMMRQVGMQQIEKDFKEKNYSTLLVCLACKAIMNFSAARYARELGIPLVMDGYSNRQQMYPEQTDEFMGKIKKLYKDAGVTYLSPLYDVLVDKNTVNQILAELGVYIAKQEPVCMWADSFSTALSEEIVSYSEKTFELIRQFDPILHC